MLVLGLVVVLIPGVVVLPCDEDGVIVVVRGDVDVGKHPSIFS
jgi:hypothetical protein